MLPFEVRQRFSKSVTLAAGDSTKEVMPAVAGVTYAIVRVFVMGLTAAAQAVYIGDSSGTNKALSLAASFPVHSQASVELLEGLKLVEGESIVVKPAAAGPSVFAVVEGYLIHARTA